MKKPDPLSSYEVSRLEHLDQQLLNNEITREEARAVEYFEYVKDASYQMYLMKFQLYAKNPLMIHLMDSTPSLRQRGKYRSKSIFIAHANTMVKTHWDFMEEMTQTTKIIERKKPESNGGEEEQSEVADLLRKTQSELAELSMSQAMEISKITEESVFGMFKEEDQIEKFYKDEILKIEKQLGENSPTKIKIVQKLNEKKENAKHLALKKIEDTKAQKLAEVNQKYDSLRAEKMKASEDVLKLRLFSASDLSVKKKHPVSPFHLGNHKKFFFPVEALSDSKGSGKGQANFQEPAS